MKAAPIAKAIKNPAAVPAQICILIRLSSLRVRADSSSCKLALMSESYDWEVDLEPSLPVTMSCSTKDRRTETMMAASMVSLRRERGLVSHVLHTQGLAKSCLWKRGRHGRGKRIRSDPRGKTHLRTTKKMVTENRSCAILKRRRE